MSASFFVSPRKFVNSPRQTDSSVLKLSKINASNSISDSPRMKHQNTLVDHTAKKEAPQLVAFKRSLSKNKLSERELPSKLSSKELQLQRERYKQLLNKVVSADKNSKVDYQLEPPNITSMTQTNSPDKVSGRSPARFFTETSRMGTFENLKLPVTRSPALSFTEDAAGMTKVSRALSESQIFPLDSNLSPAHAQSDQRPKGSISRSPYLKVDSKFNEILELQKRVKELEKQNEELRLEYKAIDEFKLAMARKTKLQDFHEKRIDLLKAQVSRQKRYIDLLHNSFKQTKTFHKDLMSVLDYLTELDKKYMRGNILLGELEKEESENQKSVQPTTKPSTADVYNILYGVFQEKNNTEEFEKFILNFNEAYDKIKHVQQTNEEVASMYTVTMQLLKSEDLLENKINPEYQKKIKYTYLLKRFIEKYKRLFPSFMTWSDYNMKEKQSFTGFLQKLEKMSFKIKDVFHKISAFDLLRHNNFCYNDEIPDLLIENTVEFEQYFNVSNKGKRLWLNAKEITALEKSLSLLLSQLMRFQRSLFLEKGKITVQQVFELEEQIRLNVEKLLCLGISTDVDSTKGGKIVVVNKLYDQGYKQAKLLLDDKQVSLKDRIEKFSLEVYSWEEENLKKFEYAKTGADLYLQKMSKLLSELQSSHNKSAQLEDVDKFKLHLDHICERYKEIHMVGKLKDLQIRYYKEYTNLLTTDSLELESFVKTKAMGIDAFFKKISDGLRELRYPYERLFEQVEGNNPKNRKEFCVAFQKFFDETTERVNRVFGASSNSLESDVKDLESSFRPQFERLQSTLNYFSERLSNISLKVY